MGERLHHQHRLHLLSSSFIPSIKPFIGPDQVFRLNLVSRKFISSLTFKLQREVSGECSVLFCLFVCTSHSKLQLPACNHSRSALSWCRVSVCHSDLLHITFRGSQVFRLVQMKDRKVARKKDIFVMFDFVIIVKGTN